MYETIKDGFLAIQQSCIQLITKKIHSKSRFTTYRARITGPELLNSVLCRLYLKMPRKLLLNLLFRR